MVVTVLRRRAAREGRRHNASTQRGGYNICETVSMNERIGSGTDGPVRATEPVNRLVELTCQVQQLATQAGERIMHFYHNGAVVSWKGTRRR
jgi:hypothetical protein